MNCDCSSLVSSLNMTGSDKQTEFYTRSGDLGHACFITPAIQYKFDFTKINSMIRFSITSALHSIGCVVTIHAANKNEALKFHHMLRFTVSISTYYHVFASVVILT